jgi:tetratricopeptide (TPR) repeat protein
MLAARTVALALALALTPVTALAYDWPLAPRADASADPLARFRWDRLSAWRATATSELRSALVALSAGPRDAPSLAASAVVLRLLTRDDEARDALRRAQTLSSERGVFDDPDVALTAAYLAARAGDFTEASTLGARALARMAPPAPPSLTHRESLVLEISRWSLARGPDGLRDAEMILRAFASAVPASPSLRAALALVLTREGHVDEARLLVIPLRDTLRATDGDDAQNPDGAVVRGESLAATGVALRLVGRHRDAIDPLTRALTTVPTVWRASVSAELDAARRP